MINACNGDDHLVEGGEADWEQGWISFRWRSIIIIHDDDNEEYADDEEDKFLVKDQGGNKPVIHLFHCLLKAFCSLPIDV